LGETLAERIEAVFEDAIRAGKISIADLQSGEYTEITGARIAELGRLFDVSRVPASGFDPPKYVTRWDAAVDAAIVPLIDEAFDALAFARPIAIAVVDLNAFIYANPRRMIADWTGDSDRDRSGNRIKRFIDDDQSLRMTRWGLGSKVESVGRRATHAQFRDAGSLLERPAGERPWGVYVYARDTRDVFNDMVIALYVRGQRQGTIRLAYDREVL
jgi:methyl-accepting chemotaxis protein